MGPGLKNIHLGGGEGRGGGSPGGVPRSSLNHSYYIRLLLCRGGCVGHFPAHIHVEEDPFPGLVDA